MELCLEAVVSVSSCGRVLTPVKLSGSQTFLAARMFGLGALHAAVHLAPAAAGHEGLALQLLEMLLGPCVSSASRLGRLELQYSLGCRCLCRFATSDWP